jgi:hypothetical protein
MSRLSGYVPSPHWSSYVLTMGVQLYEKYLGPDGKYRFKYYLISHEETWDTAYVPRYSQPRVEAASKTASGNNSDFATGSHQATGDANKPEIVMYRYPFVELVLESHVFPHFAIINAAQKMLNPKIRRGSYLSSAVAILKRHANLDEREVKQYLERIVQLYKCWMGGDQDSEDVDKREVAEKNPSEAGDPPESENEGDDFF